MILQRLSSSAPDATRSTSAARVMVIGNRDETNIGASLERGARSLGLVVEVLESKNAMCGPSWLRVVKWHFMGHTPAQLDDFSNAVLTRCAELKPTVLLTTGLAPVNEATLRKIGTMGICRCNYLTDDPWNSAQQSPWFFKAIAEYDHVFTPRRANISDLQSVSGAKVSFLRFGYDPELFFPVKLNGSDEQDFCSDVMFAGGADGDRVPYMVALNALDIRFALYGSYWNRFPGTRQIARGQIRVENLRKAIAGCRIALCLVRRANRDGHCMRTFEVPAIGACMLTEYTEEHQEIFGEDGKAVAYFHSVPEMVDKLRWLLAHEEERERLAQAAHMLIVKGRNTYKDRLSAMLALAHSPVVSR